MLRKRHKNGKPMRRTKFNGKTYTPYYLDNVANPGSMPNKWNKTMSPFVMFFASEGYTEKEIAIKLDVNLHTINYWKRTKPIFLEALEKGKDQYTNRVEKSLIENATGYTHPAIHFSVVDGTVIETPYIKQYPPNVTAQIFYLKNRARNRWMDVHRIEGHVQHRHVLDLTNKTNQELQVLKTIGLVKLPEHGSNAD